MNETERLAAQRVVDTLIRDLGEDDFATLVESLANERLKTAVGRLFSSSWWEDRLKKALVNPASAQVNTTLLCKLLDKAVPTQQSVKVGAEEGFRLVIERVEPPVES